MNTTSPSWRSVTSMLLPHPASNSIEMMKRTNLIGLDSENCIKFSLGVVLNEDSVPITAEL